MTVNKTDYHENQVADRIFANSAPDGANDGVHVALWTSSPSNAPDETNEVSGSGYSVQQVTASAWSVDNTNNPRRYDNDSIIDFGVLDSGSSTTVAGVVLYDGADTSTDNALYYGDLSGGTQTVTAGSEFNFQAGELNVEES